ncbi:M48 family metalloprotease [Streptomyces racemochromogenes]|uniref:M48 family metalloprotease n=1 Tax=Streptomyces racemochromogenes TaxID=67353 RepID=A0ABW7PGB5_9ACTN
MDKNSEPGDDLDYRHAPGTRIHYRARSRATDLAAVGRLALHLPGALCGLLLIGLLARGLQAATGIPYAVPVGLWLAAGALAFHPPSEALLARYVLRLGRPLPHELAVLAPVWREVTARAGVDGSRYQLWIEDSGGPTASGAGGHLVIVTRQALETLPTSQLAAVLAHELGHHTAGHSWARLLGWWYALPGRLAGWALAATARSGRRVAKSVPTYAVVGAALLVVLLSYRVLALTFGLPLLLAALPFLVAAVGRRTELRADRHAAGLGFGPDLARVLTAQPEEDGPGLLRLLLSPHPHPRTRLHHLQRYLEPRGR